PHPQGHARAGPAQALRGGSEHGPCRNGQPPLRGRRRRSPGALRMVYLPGRLSAGHQPGLKPARDSSGAGAWSFTRNISSSPGSKLPGQGTTPEDPAGGIPGQPVVHQTNRKTTKNKQSRGSRQPPGMGLGSLDPRKRENAWQDKQQVTVIQPG